MIKQYVFRSMLMFVLVFITACDQSGPEERVSQASVSPEQLKKRIELQRQLSENQLRITMLDEQITQASEKILRVRHKHSEKFIGLDVELGFVIPLGTEQATVAIVGFLDFECDECAFHVLDVLPRLQKNYIDTNQVRYYVRNFIMLGHSQARYAAVAAHCANDQGRYWPMFELLFLYQDQLNQYIYQELSRQVGLNPEQLINCLVDQESVERINADQLYGESVEVISPPTFFLGLINKDKITDVIMIIGARPYGEFAAMLDVLLLIDTANKQIKLAHKNKMALLNEQMQLTKKLEVHH